MFSNLLLEKTPESPLESKDIKPVNSKGNQPWLSTARTDAEAEAPVLWPSVARSQVLEKTLLLGKIEGRRRKGTEDVIFGWHHQLNGNEFEQIWEIMKDRETWPDAVHGVTKSQTRIRDWTEPIPKDLCYFIMFV